MAPSSQELEPPAIPGRFNYLSVVNSSDNVGLENSLNNTAYKFVASTVASIKDHEDIVYGGIVNDILVGGGGTDKLYGGDGVDTLVGDDATFAADGSVQSTTSDKLSDLLEGGVGNDNYYVNEQFVVDQQGFVLGNEVELAAMLDLIRDEDGLGKIYFGMDLLDLSKVTMRPNSNSNKYGDFLDVASAGGTWLGGKTVGNEIIYGFFDSSGNESSVWFKTDVGVSLPDNQPTSITPLLDQSAIIAAVVNVDQGKFLGMTFATALNQVVGTGMSEILSGTAIRDYVQGFDGIDILSGADGDDVIDGGTGNDVIHGDAGDDDILGESGGDQIYGDDGADVLGGGDGNDFLDGGAGNDRMNGGFGADTYVVDSVLDTIGYESTFLADVDNIISSVIISALQVGVENLTFSGVAALDGTGNTLANVLTGNSAANTLSGLDGNDTLDGGAGDDTLLGGRGVDKLYGGDGEDVLFGRTMILAASGSLVETHESSFVHLLKPFQGYRHQTLPHLPILGTVW